MANQRLKESKYNLIVKNGINNYIVHNMLTKNTVLLNTKELRLLKSMSNDDFNVKFVELGFLVNVNFDEVKHAVDENVIACNDLSYLNVTLIPSFGCNLRCGYCYQNGSEIKKISREAQEGFIKFVKKRLLDCKSTSFHLSWFGGEPLLFFDVVKSVSLKIKDFCERNSISFSSSISSNLTLFEENMIETFKDINITRIETTLAGLEKEHNKLRPASNSVNSFQKTFDSIFVVSRWFITMVNINFCKENYCSIKKLIKLLVKKQGQKLYVNFNEILNYKQNRRQYRQFKNTEKIKMKLFSFALKNELRICDVTNFCGGSMFCPQYHANSFAIDSELNVYKCTERCDATNRYGKIEYKTGELNVFNKNKSGLINSCMSCQFLPYCNGGCEIKRQLHEKPCPAELDSVDKYLQIFVKKKNSE